MDELLGDGKLCSLFKEFQVFKKKKHFQTSISLHLNAID